MVRVKREEVKGNILKRVVTRIDFQDMFELNPRMLSLITKICNDYNITNRIPRLLELEDFESNDKIPTIVYPYEYIKDIKSIVFFNNERNIVVEINQLFLTITQRVTETYDRYGNTINLIKDIINVINNEDKSVLNILRVSIKKANEVYFDKVENLSIDFKESIIGTNQPFNIKWNDKFTESMLVQNFNNNDKLMNLKRVIDNGIIEGKELIRLYFELEAYKNRKINPDNVIKELEGLNTFVFEVFESIFTDIGIKKLQKGEGIGVL